MKYKTCIVIQETNINKFEITNVEAMVTNPQRVKITKETK